MTKTTAAYLDFLEQRNALLERLLGSTHETVRAAKLQLTNAYIAASDLEAQHRAEAIEEPATESGPWGIIYLSGGERHRTLEKYHDRAELERHLALFRADGWQAWAEAA